MPRMRTFLTMTLGVGLGIAIAAGAVLGGRVPVPGTTPAGGDGTDPGASMPPATEAVERRTLTSHLEFEGSLDHGVAMTLRNGLAGIVTRTREPGSVVAQGEVLLEVNGNQRAVLLYGTRPAWRTMKEDIPDGADVRQLELALRALGFLPRSVAPDPTFGPATTAGVKRWQRSVGVRADGIVNLGEAVFAPGPVRISEPSVGVGEAVTTGSALAVVTAATQVVSLSVKVARAASLTVGTVVGVELPDGIRVSGTVTEVGRVAADGDGGSTLPITIGLEPGTVDDGLDGATVTVHVVRERRENVLTVPVDALLALREGGYAVEVADDDGGTHLVRVDLGMFEDGMVEVTADVAQGDRVVVPR